MSTLAHSLTRLTRRFPRPAPEDSRVVRVATLLAVLVAVAAVAIQEEFTSQAILAAGGIVVGYVVSYLRRRGSNWWLKIALTAGVLFSMREVFSGLGANPYDPPAPPFHQSFWAH